MPPVKAAWRASLAPGLKGLEHRRWAWSQDSRPWRMPKPASRETHYCSHSRPCCAWPGPDSDAAALLSAAAVVRDRGDVRDRVDADAQRSQGTPRRLTARARALDAHVQVLDALFLRGAAGVLGSHLGSEGGRLARALEALTTRRSPRQGAALTVGDGDDGVVERRVDVGNAVRNVLADLLAHPTGGVIGGRLGHCVLFLRPGLTSSAPRHPCADPCGCVRWCGCAGRASADRDDGGSRGSSPGPSDA